MKTLFNLIAFLIGVLLMNLTIQMTGIMKNYISINQ